MQSLHAKLKPRHRLIRRLRLHLVNPKSSRGRLVGGGLDVACRIGRAGLAAGKREGDGATPRGRLCVVYGFWRPDCFRCRPKSALPLRQLRPDDGWCDAPGHPAYNRRVRLPFSASHEALWREDGLYDLVLVLDWNYRRRRRGRGSAIFFHLAAADGRATAGCIAVRRADMIRLIDRLAPGAEIVTAI